MKPPLVRRNSFWLALSLVIMLIAGLGGALVQSAGNTIAVKDMRWETPSGHMMSALLFVPPGASADNKAPAVVASHGMYNNREMQDSTYIELARRGYVVLALDMLGHGFSDVVTGPERDAARATGVYDGVDLVATLPYVDTERIGLTGHSFGGRSANWSMNFDNELETPLVAAVLLQAADAEYADPDTQEYYNKYGSRDVGIIASQYDEFFFRQANSDGVMSKPRDFLSTDNAQSFLHFGAAPGDFTDERVADEVYTEEVDGSEAMRVIYSLPMIHPWVPFSASSTEKVIEFFDQSLGAPQAIDSGSQVWQWREAFGALGLVGFAMFLVAFSRWLVTTSVFSSVRIAAPAAAVSIPDRRTSAWFWGGLAISAIVSLVSYLLLFQPVQDLQPGFRVQYPPLYIGIWAAVNGLFAVVLMFVLQRTVARRNGLDPRASGAIVAWPVLGRTILAGLTVTVVAYGIVFATQYLFQTDFRMWALAVRPFGSDRIWAALLMAPLFLIYFIANSVILNVYSRFLLAGREWLNTIVVAFFTALSGILVLLLQYVVFFSTGEMNPWIQAMEGIYMFPIVVILFTAAVVGRKIYRATGNPYLAGIINGLVATLISIANTQTLGA